MSNTFFNEKNYLYGNPDVAANWQGDPYDHWLINGQFAPEHRLPDPAYKNIDQFKPEVYLAGYPDLKSYEGPLLQHWLENGFAEGRQMNPPPVEQPDDKTIDQVTGQSMFSLLQLIDGDLLAGTYSWPNAVAEIRLHGQVIARLNCGESIFSMVQRGNEIIVSTEDEGRIYRGTIGGWDFKQIAKLRGGVYGGAFDLREIEGHIFAVGGGEIHVLGRGTVLTFSDDYYIKSIFKYGGVFYAPGYKKSTNHAGWFVSMDLNHWVWEDKILNARFIRGENSPDGSRVIIAGTLNYSGGQHHRNSAAVFMLDEEGVRPHWGAPGYDYMSVAKWENDGSIICGLTRGWRSQEPGAQIVRLTHTTEVLEYFPEAEVRDIALDENYIYTATRTDQRGGKVYRTKKKK